MLTRFRFYRHRRLLPFAAVYALVFINGATLVPFVPPPSVESLASTPDEPATPAQADAWRWSQYERGQGHEQGPVVSAGPPPLVKNLRRAPLDGHVGCTAHRPVARRVDSPGPSQEFMHRAEAANAADLSRLCRLLL